MPNRIIKESICYSGDIDKLTPFEETVFYRLIVNCDDYGRFDARPTYLKNMLFRTRDNVTLKSIEAAISKLALIGLVRLYEVDGNPILCLPKWDCHQQVRAKKSKYPAPDSNGYQMISDDCTCPRNPIQSESESESVSETGYTPLPPVAVVGQTELEKTMDDFVTMRNKIKKPATERALGTIRKKLQDLAPDDERTQVLILEQSIERCWQTVYPLKDNYSANSGAHPQRELRKRNIYAELAEKARAAEKESVVIGDDTG